MAEIILHNYPQSPVAEKVRKGLGIKRLAWRSVEIPRIPPKPLLTELTGAYRRTPVMQIGAEIYCDSLCILREIERRHPEPSFFPGGAEGLAWGLARWTDGEVFSLVIRLVLGAEPSKLDPAFAADRGRLYLGPDWEQGLEAAHAELSLTAAQLRAEFGWLDRRLADAAFLFGDAPGLADALAWHVVWFLRGRWPGGPDLLAEFQALNAWEARMEAIGHGSASDLDAEAAIEIAAANEPEAGGGADPRDPQGLAPGMEVAIRPDADAGEEPTRGPVLAVTRDTVTIGRESPRAGRLAIHFPRAGYRVTRV